MLCKSESCLASSIPSECVLNDHRDKASTAYVECVDKFHLRTQLCLHYSGFLVQASNSFRAPTLLITLSSYSFPTCYGSPAPTRLRLQLTLPPTRTCSHNVARVAQGDVLCLARNRVQNANTLLQSTIAM